MKTWGVATRPMRCGNCGTAIGEGEGVVLIELPKMTRALVRGECCEGEAPPSLPAHVVTWNRTKPMRALSTLAPRLRRTR